MYIIFKIGLSFKNIGVSLIGKYNKKRLEFAYVSFENAEMMIIESEKSKVAHCRIKFNLYSKKRFIHIDNNGSRNT
jgi:hypothetical protein